MKKRSLLLAGVALVAAVPFTAQPAAAAARCDNGYVCVWSKPNFGGGERDRKLRPGCYGTVTGGARSVSNQSGKRITLYSDTGCYGSKVDIKTGHYSSSLPWKARSVAVWG
ncbi:peptidase inhibitor family I36 protein [Streptomyces sp. NPDC088360]|uniref:peptidase inhibitor family I36 protein n=1 Tax=Streptomyces sp. NPDC088360 TaxID=3154515 RepID=UPI00344E37E3